MKGWRGDERANGHIFKEGNKTQQEKKKEEEQKEKLALLRSLASRRRI